MTKETKDIQQLRLNLRQLTDDLNKLSYYTRLIRKELKINEKIIHSNDSSASILNIF